MKRYASCGQSKDDHVIVIENYMFNGYYMLRDLPQDKAWTYHLGCFVSEPTVNGFGFGGFVKDEEQATLNEKFPNQSFSILMGKGASMEEVRRQAMDLHNLICNSSLVPLVVDGVLAGVFQDGYGWKETDGVTS